METCFFYCSVLCKRLFKELYSNDGVKHLERGGILKKILILFTVISSILVGCTQEKGYSVWIEASQGPVLIDTAKERLINAEIDFILDDNGSVLINEKDFDKAVLCCS